MSRWKHEGKCERDAVPVGNGLWEKCLRSVLGSEQEILCNSETVHGDRTGGEKHADAQEVPHGSGVSWSGYMECYGVKEGMWRIVWIRKGHGGAQELLHGSGKVQEGEWVGEGVQGYVKVAAE